MFLRWPVSGRGENRNHVITFFFFHQCVKIKGLGRAEWEGSLSARERAWERAWDVHKIDVFVCISQRKLQQEPLTNFPFHRRSRSWVLLGAADHENNASMVASAEPITTQLWRTWLAFLCWRKSKTENSFYQAADSSERIDCFQSELLERSWSVCRRDAIRWSDTEHPPDCWWTGRLEAESAACWCALWGCRPWPDGGRSAARSSQKTRPARHRNPESTNAERSGVFPSVSSKTLKDGKRVLLECVS